MFSRQMNARAVMLSALVFLPVMASGQAPGRKTLATPHPQAGNNESRGLKATILSITKLPKGFSVQLQVQNTTQDTLLASPISSDDANGSGETASSASGSKFMIEGNGRSIVGMDPCYITGFHVTYTMAIASCLKSATADAMTRLEPGQTTLLAITYAGAGDPGANVSFALRFVVRDLGSSGSTDETLSSNPSGPSKAAFISAISFALVPLPDASTSAP